MHRSRKIPPVVVEFGRARHQYMAATGELVDAGIELRQTEPPAQGISSAARAGRDQV